MRIIENGFIKTNNCSMAFAKDQIDARINSQFHQYRKAHKNFTKYTESKYLIFINYYVFSLLNKPVPGLSSNPIMRRPKILIKIPRFVLFTMNIMKYSKNPTNSSISRHFIISLFKIMHVT